MTSKLIVPRADAINWQAHARVDKFDIDTIRAWQRKHEELREPTGDELIAFASPYEVAESEGNLLTTAGLNRITALIIGAAGQAWNTANSRLGVGNGVTAAAVADTDLSAAAGATNRQFVVADATYPTQANGVITQRATHTTGLSNFAWQEWCIDNGTVNGTTVVAVMMNRKVTSLGTKTSAASWVFTVTVTLT